jgi:hypothetical protein
MPAYGSGGGGGEGGRAVAEVRCSGGGRSRGSCTSACSDTASHSSLLDVRQLRQCFCTFVPVTHVE